METTTETNKRETAQSKKVNCGDVDRECVFNHICYKYSVIVMSCLIETIDFFAGSQGPKVLRRILSNKLPPEMMKILGFDGEVLKKIREEELLKAIPAFISGEGGPNFEIQKTGNGEYKFTVHECHFLPYSKTKGFCEVTAGLMLGFAQMLSGKPMDIEIVQTISQGNEFCEFIAKERKKPI